MTFWFCFLFRNNFDCCYRLFFHTKASSFMVLKRDHEKCLVVDLFSFSQVSSGGCFPLEEGCLQAPLLINSAPHCKFEQTTFCRCFCKINSKIKKGQDEQTRGEKSRYNSGNWKCWLVPSRAMCPLNPEWMLVGDILLFSLPLLPPPRDDEFLVSASLFGPWVGLPHLPPQLITLTYPRIRRFRWEFSEIPTTQTTQLPEPLPTHPVFLPIVCGVTVLPLTV